MAARMRSRTSFSSNALSGASGSDGTSAAGQRRAVDVLAGGQRRRRLDRVDADDRAAEARLVRTDARREIGERRLGAELAPQLLARGFELPALAANAARPGIAAERVDHRAADPALGKGFELDAARFVEPAARRRSARACRPARDRRARSSAASRRRLGARGIRRMEARRQSGRAGWLRGADASQSPWSVGRASVRADGQRAPRTGTLSATGIPIEKRQKSEALRVRQRSVNLCVVVC